MFWIAYEGEVTALEVDLVLGKRLAAHRPRARLGPVRAAAAPRRRGPRCSSGGPDFLLYTITDGIVDGYFPVLDALDDEIDELQDDVIARPTTWTLERLFTLKRELISLRRAIVAVARDLQPADEPRPGR